MSFDEHRRKILGKLEVRTQGPASGLDAIKKLDLHFTTDDDPMSMGRTFYEATDEAGEVVYICLGCKGFAKDPSDIRHDPDCTVQEDGTEFLIEEDCS